MSRGSSSLGLCDLYPKDDLTSQNRTKKSINRARWLTVTKSSYGFSPSINVVPVPEDQLILSTEGRGATGRGGGVGEPSPILGRTIVVEPMTPRLAPLFGLRKRSNLRVV